MRASRWCLLVVAAVQLCFWPPGIAPATEEPSTVLQLRKSRVECAKKVYLANWKENVRLDPALDIERLHLWSRRWLDAELALSEKKEDQLAAFSRHLDRMKKVEERAKANSAAQLSKRVDEPTVAEYYRLDAEIRLADAKAKLP